MRILLVLIPLLLFTLTVGCVNQGTTAPNVATPIATLPSVVTTPTPAPLLEKTVTIKRDTYSSWEFTLHIGKRYAVEVVTDGAPVDLLVLDAANYGIFATAFYSRSGSPWENYVILAKDIVQDKVEFKVSQAGRYRVIIENADVIPGGAVTTRDVNVIVRVHDLN